MKKKIIILVVLILAGAATYRFKFYQPHHNKTADGTLKLYGTIDFRDAALAFNEQERIAEILVEEGDEVQKGQILARLDSDRINTSITELEARIAAQQEQVDALMAGSRPQEIAIAKAEVDAAQAQLDNSKRLLTRLEKSASGSGVSEQDLDNAKSQLAVNQALLQVRQRALSLSQEGARKEDIAAAGHQLAALRANLRLLQIRQGDMSLTAPSHGIIQSRTVEVGEIAGPQKPALILALNDPKWVRTYVSEPDLGKIRPGMHAQVISDSFPDRQLSGTIGFISPVAEFTPRTVQTEELRTKLVYETRIQVPDPDNELRLGMPVTIKIAGTAASEEAAGQ